MKNLHGNIETLSGNKQFLKKIDQNLFVIWQQIVANDLVTWVTKSDTVVRYIC